MNRSPHLFTAIEYALSFLGIFWFVWLIDTVFSLNLGVLGVYPRSIDGLIGVITSPFIHGGLEHLLANTIPFGILCTLLFLFYKKNAFLFFILNWITAGLGTWLIGREAYHIGVSGVIYAIASFLIFGGIFSRKFKLIIPSIIVIVAYSGLLWGIFPTDGNVSWEGHLAGAVSGIVWAYVFRKSL